jgi:hypothetical protein
MIERRPLSQPAAGDHGSIAFLSANTWTRTDLLHFGMLMVGLDYGLLGGYRLTRSPPARGTASHHCGWPRADRKRAAGACYQGRRLLRVQTRCTADNHRHCLKSNP